MSKLFRNVPFFGFCLSLALPGAKPCGLQGIGICPVTAFPNVSQFCLAARVPPPLAWPSVDAARHLYHQTALEAAEINELLISRE
jgi:hypothetical protein